MWQFSGSGQVRFSLSGDLGGPGGSEHCEDHSGWIDVPADPCGNGIQDPGETCETCPEDMPPGACTPPAICGANGCEPGENSLNCCTDCGCPAGASCSDNQCVPLLGCFPPCRAGEVCQGDICVPAGGPTCGDGVPDPGETCVSCPADLKLKPRVIPSKLVVSVGEPLTASASAGTLQPAPVPSWYFGDGTLSVHAQQATHTYTAPGNYQVQVSGNDALCGVPVTSAPQTVFVRSEVCYNTAGPESCCGNGQCDPSDVRFCPEDCLPTNPCETQLCDAGCAARPAIGATNFVVGPGQSVVFTVNSAHVDDPNPSWDFGDGQFAGGRIVEHSYASPGTYQVILTAHEDVCGSVQLSRPYSVVVRFPGGLPSGDDAIVSDLSIPGCVLPGSAGSFSIALTNVGQTSWTSSGHWLDVWAPELSSLTMVPLGPAELVGPGLTRTFRIPYEAPTQEGSASLSAMMHGPGGPFGGHVGLSMLVRPDCHEPPPPGEFTCHVRVRRSGTGDPLPGVLVALRAHVLSPGQAPGPVTVDTERTDQYGQAQLSVSPGIPVQRVECTVPGVEPVNRSNTEVRSDPVAVPVGTTLDLDLLLSPYLPPQGGFLQFMGLKNDRASWAYLTRSGAYDKPVVIAMPFDRAEQTAEALGIYGLYRVFGDLRRELLARGYDVWQVLTTSGQNYHEQAAELAQVMNAASHITDTTLDVILVGYSGGGLASRLATARYEAEPDWRDDLGVRDRLPVDLIVFGDAPLLGAHANYCLQDGLWRQVHPFMSVADKFNLNSCGAQALLLDSYPSHGGNRYSFFESGASYDFPLGRGSKPGVCDRVVDDRCQCDGGPPLIYAGLDGNGWAHTRMVAMSASTGDGTPQTCYLDTFKDADVLGNLGCNWNHPPEEYPRASVVGERLLKIQVAAGLDYDCIKEPLDVTPGSKLSKMIKKEECEYGACGGVRSYDNFTFIPRWSALPAGAPFDEIVDLDFHGFHAKTYPGHVAWAVDRMDETAAARPNAAQVHAAADNQRTFEVGGTPLLPSVTVTLPDPVGSGTVSATGTEQSPAPHPGYVLPGAGQYIAITTSQGFNAAWKNPVTVCVQTDGMTFSDASRADLFTFGPNGWEKVTTARPEAPPRVCGATTALGIFAVLEPENHVPLAQAGPDQTDQTPPVLLSGAASYDPDGEDLSFEWRRTALLAETPFATTAMTWLDLPAGTHTLYLTVRDPHGAGATDSVVVGVAPPGASVNDNLTVETNDLHPHLIFRVALAWPCTQAVRVSYATADGTAQAGSDYAAASSEVVIPAGQSGTNFSVEINGDLLYEADETLRVQLSNPVGAVLDDSQGVGTIRNDDPPPVASVGDVSVAEGQSGTTAANFTITLSAASGLPAGMSYATLPGSAQADDYLPVAAELVIPAGATSVQVPVAVRGDRQPEADETFSIEIKDSAHASIGRGVASATIVNDDSDGPSVSDETGIEPGSGANLVVFKVFPPLAGETRLSYATVAGSATAGSDYDAASGSLTLIAGSPPALVPVSVRSDLLREGPETLSLALQSLGRGPIVASGTATIYDRPTAGDVDGDGRPDLFWRHTQSGALSIWLMDGTTRREERPLDPASIGADWQVAGTADMDEDGRTDILWRNSSSGALSVWFMDGLVRRTGSFTNPNGVAELAWTPVGTGDFDSDGQPDIVWRNAGSGKVVVWLMNGAERRAGNFTTPDGAETTWVLAGIGDFDGDGQSDLLWRNAGSGAAVLWFMDGLVRRYGTYLLPTESELDWRVSAIADINADGHSDVIWQRGSTGELRAWSVDGALRLQNLGLLPAQPGPGWLLGGPR